MKQDKHRYPIITLVLLLVGSLACDLPTPTPDAGSDDLVGRLLWRGEDDFACGTRLDGLGPSRREDLLDGERDGDLDRGDASGSRVGLPDRGSSHDGHLQRAEDGESWRERDLRGRQRLPGPEGDDRR